MRLIRSFVLLGLLAALGWFATQSVRVHTSDDEVQITIDRHRLRAAGSSLKTKGRSAMSQVGRALEQAGDALDEEEPREDSPIERIFSR